MSALRFAVRVRPGASRVAVGGAYDGPKGRALVVTVTARPVGGQATRAALRALAGALDLRRDQVSCVAGMTSRDKLVAVDPAPAGLRGRIDTLLDGR